MSKLVYFTKLQWKPFFFTPQESRDQQPMDRDEEDENDGMFFFNDISREQTYSRVIQIVFL